MTTAITPANPEMTREGIASHYDDLDEFYREIWGEHVHHGVWHTGRESDTEAAENLVAMVVKAGHIDPGAKVLDIGCGYGATAKILAERHGADVTGMTLSDVQLAYANKNNSVPGKTHFMLQDWYQARCQQRITMWCSPSKAWNTCPISHASSRKPTRPRSPAAKW
jgi:tocopherol O-methyltransferase